MNTVLLLSEADQYGTVNDGPESSHVIFIIQGTSYLLIFSVGYLQNSSSAKFEHYSTVK